jgi:drug/metabolite transporter (DMT)-like permease
MDFRLTALLVLVPILNAICYPLVTLGLDYAPHLTFAALRALLAGGSLALIAIALRRPMPPDLRAWIALGLVGLCATTSAYFGMFHAAEFVSPGLATVITNSQPLIAAVLASAFLSERLRNVQYVGLGLGFAGIVVVSFPQLGLAEDEGFTTGLGYIIIAAVGIAIGNVLMKDIRTRVDPLVAMSVQLLLGAVPFVFLAALFEDPTAIQLSPTFVLALLGLALPGTALAFWLWFWLLGRVALSRANGFTFLTPFFALALGATFFGEPVATPTIIGLLISVAGIGLAERSAGRELPPRAEQRPKAP